MQDKSTGLRASAAPQKLAPAFSTADVVPPGWSLGRLADLLRENNLAAVPALAKWCAEVDRHMPFVATVIITPVEELMPN